MYRNWGYSVCDLCAAATVMKGSYGIALQEFPDWGWNLGTRLAMKVFGLSIKAPWSLQSSYCRKKNSPSAMALLAHFLLLAILGACTCVDLMEVPDSADAGRFRRDNPNGAIIYPESFMLATGPYGSSGKYTATGQLYNGYPIYNGPGTSTYWKIYLRSSGPAAGKWVLNGNVHENWHGTVAYMDTLFSPKV